MVDEAHEPARGSSGFELDGARSPRLVLVPDQLGVERAYPPLASVCGSSSSPNQNATSPPMTTGRSPISTTTTCVPRVWPAPGRAEPGQQLDLAVDRHVPHADAPGDPQVVSMNGVLASEASNCVLDLLTGYSGGRRGARQWQYAGRSGELAPSELPSRRRDCPACAQEGHGDPPAALQL